MRLSRVSSSILLRSFASAFLLALLTGCAAIQHEEILLEPTVPQKMISPKRKTASSIQSFSCEFGWNRVVYQGEIRDSQTNQAQSRVCVALCEGNDILSQTRTDSEGRFKIDGNLFGKPFSLSDGGSEWRPEGYYALVAQSDNEKKGSILLRDISPSEQIVLNLQ